jgi:hypothetical protein
MTLHVHQKRGNNFSRFVAAAIVALAASVFGESSFAGVAASASVCGPHATVVWLESRGNPGAGSVYYTLRLTNLSQVRCSLRGYPGVSAIDLANRQLGSAAGRNARYPIRTVVLAPGNSAQFLLQLNDPGFFSRPACRPSTAAGLRVYLPDATTASVVPVPLGACSRAGPLFLHATAVTQ